MESEVEGEIILRSGGREAFLPDIPRPILQAIHETITGPKETHTVRRHRSVVANENDIAQLCTPLEQWTDTYHPISRVLNIKCVTVAGDKIKGDKKTQFKDIESFLRSYVPLTEPTKSIGVSYDVIIKNQDKGVIDKIGVTVEIRAVSDPDFRYGLDDEDDSDEPSESSLIYASNLPDAAFSCKISVSYTNYLMSKGLVDVVEQWFNALTPVQRKKMGKVRRFFRGVRLGHDRYHPAHILALSCTGASSAIALFGISKSETFGSYEVFSSVSGNILILVILFFLQISIFGYLYRKLGGGFDNYERHLSLNQGDRRRIAMQEEKFKKQDEREKFYVNTIIASYVVGLAVTASTNLIP